MRHLCCGPLLLLACAGSEIPPYQLVPAEYLGIGHNQGELGASAADAEAAAADCDTIAAIVTGAAQGAVSIIRLSGIDAVPIAQQVFRPARARRQQRQPGRVDVGSPAAPAAAQEPQVWEPESHRVYYGTVVDARGAVVDEASALGCLPTARALLCS